MKKQWTLPRIFVQEFESNEYVAACWGVGCSWEVANKYEQEHGYWDNGNVSHAGDHCGNTSNQVIFDYNNDGVADAMIETGTDGLGNLECTIYDSPSYSRWDIIPVNTVKVGDYIYWTTTSGNRTWHHQGYVTATAEGHPNRS